MKRGLAIIGLPLANNQATPEIMALLNILEYPDPRLRQQAEAVTDFNTDLRTLVADMFETMYAAPGIGLAATQVGVALQLFVADLSEDKNQPQVFINPKLLDSRGIEEMEEGCLSFPGFYAKVQRANEVLVRAQDLDGKEFQIDTGELLAVCIQHEMDHLQGKLFVDYLSPLKRQRLDQKLAKEARARRRS